MTVADVRIFRQVLRNIAGARPHVTAADKVSGRAPFYGSMAKRLINQGVRVYEVAFWVRLCRIDKFPQKSNSSSLSTFMHQDPTETTKLARTSRAASCPGFIDVSFHNWLYPLYEQHRSDALFVD